MAPPRVTSVAGRTPMVTPAVTPLADAVKGRWLVRAVVIWAGVVTPGSTAMTSSATLVSCTGGM